MATTYTPFRQDNGVDSWIVEETDNEGTLTSRYMVYDDPNKKASIRELEKLSAAEVDNFKQLLGVTGGGGTVTLTSGEGIDVVDDGNGSYTINSTVRGGTEGYTGMVQIFDGKKPWLLDFQNGLLVNVIEQR